MPEPPRRDYTSYYNRRLISDVRPTSPASARPVPASPVLKPLAPLASRPKRRKLAWRPASLYALGLLIFAAGVLVTLNGFRTNQQVVAQVKHSQANPSSNSVNPRAPSTQPVTSAARSSYVVAPDLPRYLKIPKIGVYARVLQVGVLASGALGTPPDIYDTAWYTGSAKPGDPGATLIDGHLDGAYADGVFWNLHKLAPGDQIQIIRGDGAVLTYQVVKTQAFDANDPNMMQSAITPITPGKSGLNLITCNGNLNSKFQYNQRLVVYASQV